MSEISQIQLIGNEVAILWADGTESYYPMHRLRALSPSAETQGEQDLFGNQMGPDNRGKDYSGVTVIDWKPVGGYAIQFHFSDGHRTGLYSFPYLREIADKV